jgi:hypothetical protein
MEDPGFKPDHHKKKKSFSSKHVLVSHRFDFIVYVFAPQSLGNHNRKSLQYLELGRYSNYFNRTELNI